MRNKCFACHGEGKDLEGGFDIRTRAGVLKGGENGAVVVTGKPEESRLYQAVLRIDKLRMPPKDDNALSPVEINAVRKWIEMDLPWTAEAGPTVTKWDVVDGDAMLTSGGIDPSWTNRKYRREDLWAYFPVKRVEVPKVEHAGNEIDAFIAAKLAENKLSPAPPADAITWLRRVTFDLTGLPPTPKEIAGFELRIAELKRRTLTPALSQRERERGKIPHPNPQSAFRNPQSTKSSTACSPARTTASSWARHWLDVVRYADTGGFANDFERPHAWRYRDYVDPQLQRRQAVRPLRPRAARRRRAAPRPTRRCAIAVGFLRMGPWEHTGMSVAAVTRQQFLDDVTNSVGVDVPGPGLRCCRCHDHKFDPLPTRDYYRLQAVFAREVRRAHAPCSFLASENTPGFAAPVACTRRSPGPRPSQGLHASVPWPPTADNDAPR